jgi:hypothetical protein
VLLTTAATLAPPAVAGAARFHVDCMAGSDANPGTDAAPWRTLEPVNDRTFTAGDRIELRRGCAWAGGLVESGDGTATAPITITGYGSGPAPAVSNSGRYSHAVDISGDHVVVDDLHVTGAHEAGVLFRAGADHGVVRNTEVTGTGLGVVLAGRFGLATRNDVHDLHMVVDTAAVMHDDYGAVCFWIENADNTVSGNRGTDCRAPSADYGHDGGFAEVWESGARTVVRHNYAENTEGFLEIGGGPGTTADGIRVYQNLIVNAHGGLCLHTGGAFASVVRDFRFSHNSYYNATGDAYRVLDCMGILGWSQLLVRNNVFHSDAPIATWGTFLHSGNLYAMTGGAPVGYAVDASEAIGDPLWANVAARDFRLGSGSPAVDLASDLGLDTDYGGNPMPRGAAPDAGAFERQ